VSGLKEPANVYGQRIRHRGLTLGDLVSTATTAGHGLEAIGDTHAPNDAVVGHLIDESRRELTGGAAQAEPVELRVAAQAEVLEGDPVGLRIGYADASRTLRAEKLGGGHAIALHDAVVLEEEAQIVREGERALRQLVGARVRRRVARVVGFPDRPIVKI